MRFEHAVIYLGEKIDHLTKAITKIDGFLEGFASWFFILTAIVLFIWGVSFFSDLMITVKIQSREEAARELRRVA